MYSALSGHYKWKTRHPLPVLDGCSAYNWGFFCLSVTELVWEGCGVTKEKDNTLESGCKDSLCSSPSFLFVLVNVTVTGTRYCHTPACGATALTWAVMRWDQVSTSRGYLHASHTRCLRRADKFLLVISSTCSFFKQEHRDLFFF